MGWVLALVMTVIAALFVALYKSALNEGIYLSSLIVLILSDDEIHLAQKNGILSLVLNAQANSAGELSNKVNRSICELATKLGRQTPGSSVLGAHAYLWNLKSKQ